MKQPLDLDIVVISWLPSLYSNTRFIAEANKNNLKIKILSPFEITLEHSKKYSQIPHILRIGDFRYHETISHLQQFDLNYINNILSFTKYRNKMTTYKIWSKEQIPFPETYTLSFSTNEILNSQLETIDEIKKNNISLLYGKIQNLFFHSKNNSKPIEFKASGGSEPFVLKHPYGLKGKNVHLIKTPSELETYSQNADYLILQKYHPECYGVDYRTFLIQDQIFTIQRTNPNDFRSNLSLGATAKAFQLSSSEINQCKNIFKLSGLCYAGIDMIQTNEGAKFLEINVSPGFEGIEKTYGVNIAKLIFSNTF